MVTFNEGGRPAYSTEELDGFVTKLAPYLQRGLSVREACREAQISYGTIYRRMKDTDWFCNKIEVLQQFKSVIYSDIRLKQLIAIYDKILKNQEVTDKEESFLRWLGEHDRSLADMFGNKVRVSEPEDEIRDPILRDPEAVKALLEMYKSLVEDKTDKEKSRLSKQLEKFHTNRRSKTTAQNGATPPKTTNHAMSGGLYQNSIASL